MQVRISNSHGLRDHDRHGPERDSHLVGRGKPLAHIQLVGRHAVRQPPLERVQQRRQDKRHDPLRQRHAGAQPSPGPERDEFEGLPPEIHPIRHVHVQEPLRHELVGPLPRRRVPHDRPRVEDDRRPFRHGVAADLHAFVCRQVRQQDRRTGCSRRDSFTTAWR